MRALNGFRSNVILSKENRRSQGPAKGCSRLTGCVEEAFELSAADRMLQFADCLRLDLADALAGHLEDSAHLFERVGVTVAQAVAQLDDLALAVGQRLEDVFDLVLEHFLRGSVDRRLGAFVLDEVAEVAVLAFADRPIEADGMLAD